MKSLKLSALVVLALALATLKLHAQETGSFDRNLQVSGVVDLDVTSGSGSVKVHSGASGNVHVYAFIRARDSWFGISAQEKVKRLQANPPIEQLGNTIHVGRIEDRELQQNVSIDYDITVPAQTKLSSQTGSGSQTVEGLQLGVNVHAGSGGITVENVSGSVRARTGSGTIRVNNIKGSLDAEAGSGSIRAHGIGGEVSVNTGSGNIEVEQTAPGSVRAGAGSGSLKLYGVKGSVRAETGSGHISVEGDPTGDWRVGTGSGGIDLRIPQNASFTIDARTSSGRLSVNRQVSMQGTFSRNHVQGKVGNGGVLLDLHTGSGNIEVD